MTDELDELRRVNPVAAGDLEPVVATDWREAVELLEAADDRSSITARRRRSVPPAGRASTGRRAGLNNRAGFTAATVAVAAAAAVAVIVPRIDRLPTDGDVVLPADDGGPTSALVVEQRQDDPSSAVAGSPDGSSTTVESIAPPRSVASTASTTAATTGSDTTVIDAPATTVADTVDGPFDPSVDLLAVHFDFAHLDDGHAAVAALEVAGTLGIDPFLVAGTQAAHSGRSPYEYVDIMTAAWGDAWLDAGRRRKEAVTTAARRWLATVDVGGRVWVAEGGVSDFTAEVIEEIRRRRPELDTTAVIQVVQHSDRNERATVDANLRFVRTTSVYTRIDDGNLANGSADLHRPSARFEAAALTGTNRPVWLEAFDYLPADNLDFSDTVTVLHIIGIGVDQIAGPDDFAARFLD